MKFLRLHSENAYKDHKGFVWYIPLRLEHDQVGVSSVNVIFDKHFDTENCPISLPIQCNLIKESMWNQKGVLYNMDLSGEWRSYSARPGGVGKLLL